MTDLSELQAKRGAIYGPVDENHRGIAKMWSPLLQAEARWLIDGYDLPEHVVEMCMALVKCNRTRRVYHEDNYDDALNYLVFARDAQAKFKRPAREYHRIYVAGPYTADTADEVERNCQAAAEAAAECMRRGHDAHCPHAATAPVAAIVGGMDYERWMRLDFGIIRCWATALLLIRGSPGANRERELAEKIGLEVWTSIDEVPVT